MDTNNQKTVKSEEEKKYEFVIDNRLCCVMDEGYPSRTRDYFLKESSNIVLKKPNDHVIERMKKLYNIFELRDSYHVEFHQLKNTILYSVEYYEPLNVEEKIKLLSENDFKLKTIYAGDGWITLDIEDPIGNSLDLEEEESSSCV